MPKPIANYFHPDAEILGRGVVAELVNQDHESEHDPHDENGVKEGQKLGHIYQTTPKIPITKWP